MPDSHKKEDKPSKTGFLSDMKNVINSVKDSKFVKISTGSAVSRAIGVVMIGMVATIATIPATIIGLSSIAIGTVMDVLQTRSLRLTRKENLLLSKNRDAKDKQDAILQKEPLLANALDDVLAESLAKYLKVPDKIVPNFGDQHLPDKNTENNANKTVSVSAYGLAMIKNSISTAKEILNLVVNPSIINMGKVAKATWGIYSESKNQATKEEISLEFRQRIRQERYKSDTPVYNNLVELAEASREQRVNALALQKLVNDGSFRTSSPKMIRKQFEQAKKEIFATEKAIVDTRGVIGTMKSYAKDFIRAHNPFSIYNNLDQLNRELRTNEPRSPENKITKSSQIKIPKLSKQTVIDRVKDLSKTKHKKQAVVGHGASDDRKKKSQNVKMR